MLHMRSVFQHIVQCYYCAWSLSTYRTGKIVLRILSFEVGTTLGDTGHLDLFQGAELFVSQKGAKNVDRSTMMRTNKAP